MQKIGYNNCQFGQLTLQSLRQSKKQAAGSINAGASPTAGPFGSIFVNRVPGKYTQKLSSNYWDNLERKTNVAGGNTKSSGADILSKIAMGVGIASAATSIVAASKNDGAGIFKNLFQKISGWINGANTLKEAETVKENVVQQNQDLNTKVEQDQTGIANAQKADTGATQQVNNAKEGQSVAQEGVATSEQNLSVADGQQQVAQTANNEATISLNEAQAELDFANMNLSIQTTEDGRLAAQQRVDAAQRKVDEAKIQEQKTKDELNKADAQKDKAQQGLNDANNNLQNAEGQLDKANSNKQKTGQDVKGATQTFNNDKGEQTKVQNDAIPKADEKINNLKQQEGEAQTLSKTDGSQGQEVGRDHLEYQDSKLASGKYSDADRQKVLNDREAILSLKPGESVDNGYSIYTMNDDGSITQRDKHTNLENGSYDDQSINIAAYNSGDETLRQVDARQQDRVLDEMTVSKGGSGLMVKSEDYEVNHPQTVKTSANGVKTVYNSKANTAPQGASGQNTDTALNNTTIPAAGNNSNRVSENIHHEHVKFGNSEFEQYMVNSHVVNKDQYDAALNMDQDVIDAGFNPGSECEIKIGENADGDDESVSFRVYGGKYYVDEQEVDSKEFLQKYQNALDEQAKNEVYSDVDMLFSDPNRVSLLAGDDYSKYKKK